MTAITGKRRRYGGKILYIGDTTGGIATGTYFFLMGRFILRSRPQDLARQS